MIRQTLVAASLAVFGLATPALADERYFVWGYNANTPSAGEREIELISHAKNLTGTFEHQLAFDYGLTDRWAIEPYVQFAQTGLSSFAASGAKFQTRYRLVDDLDFVPALTAYAEIQQPFDLTRWGYVEGKALLHKNLGDAQVATNLVVKQSLVTGKPEFGYTLGASYPVLDWLVLAAEAKGSNLFSGKDTHIAGPTAFLRTSGARLGVGWGHDLSGGTAHQIRGMSVVEF
jgi:hypothetical protein